MAERRAPAGARSKLVEFVAIAANVRMRFSFVADAWPDVILANFGCLTEPAP